jgi:hypothetical protein
MASKGLELKQTKGTFQFRGIVTGTKKDGFYSVKKTKETQVDFRTINFGVQVSSDSILYVTFNGMVQKEVFYSGKPKGSDKNITEKVKWENRYNYKKEGLRLIGINCGLEKTVDEKGKEVNDKKILVPFDATEYVHEHLVDGMSVFVKGNIEYGHFSNKDEVTRTVKFIPNQISLCQEVDFEAKNDKSEPYQVINNFTQDIVFQSIEQSEDKTNFILSAQIVNYATIEQADFVVEDVKLAKNLRKLKPYTFISTWGLIQTVRNTDTVEVEDNDGWGDSNPMKRVNSPYKTLRVLTGADPASIDVETFTEDKIEEALEKVKNTEKKEKAFESADDDDWGDSSKKSDSDDKSDTPW